MGERERKRRTREEGRGERFDDSAMQGIKVINRTNIQSGLGVIALAPSKRRRQDE